MLIFIVVRLKTTASFKLPYGEDTMGRTILMGAVIGFVGGMLFSVLYFGTGQITTPMAYIHDVSGALLGVLIAWIVGLHKRSAAGQK